MPFQPGKSGNPDGTRGAKVFRAAIMAALKRVQPDGIEAVQKIADQLVAQAMAGDVRSADFVAERTDGKVAQPISGADDEPPIVMEVIRRVIVEHAGETVVSQRDARLIEGGNET